MNQCDLEEAKHLALEKFKELIKRPEEWEYNNNSWVLSPWYEHKTLNFKLWNGSYGAILQVGDVRVANCDLPKNPEKPTTVETYSNSYTGVRNYGPNPHYKPLTSKQKAAYKDALKEYNKHWLVKAYQSLVDYDKKKEDERLCNLVVKALTLDEAKEKCEKLIHALNENLAPVADDIDADAIVKKVVASYAATAPKKPWWRIW